MRAYVDSQRDWLQAERLPAYAPELNPVEYLWANLKDMELANRPTTTWPRSPTPPNRASNESASTRTWWSVLGSHRPHPQPMNRQPNPRNSISFAAGSLGPSRPARQEGQRVDGASAGVAQESSDAGEGPAGPADVVD